MARNYKGYQIRKRNSSFEIRINHHGKTYYHTYHAPENLTPSKQYAEAEKEAIWLRDKIRTGHAASIPLFKDYAEYVLETKKSLSNKRSTQNEYKYVMRRLIDEFGNDPLDYITPARLNRFYISLKNATTDIDDSAEAVGTKIRDHIRSKSITIKKLAAMANIATNTASLTINGSACIPK